MAPNASQVRRASFLILPLQRLSTHTSVQSSLSRNHRGGLPPPGTNRGTPGAGGRPGSPDGLLNSSPSRTTRPFARFSAQLMYVDGQPAHQYVRRVTIRTKLGVAHTCWLASPCHIGAGKRAVSTRARLGWGDLLGSFGGCAASAR
ncbi:hypothetical protein B0T16DRAFT_210542 [Cercophora newfieldiana]|uniref:Uncharacterized protein n=1 Tax=Cercophora newfieldiana TaxID=92897 RepID=A0AA40CKV4_9PEZI|nr:hypothetical protein B0T16DRAFT_210542 [Cercophora newfieldiana]